MTETNITTLIIAIVLLIAIGLVLFLLRGKVKKAEVRAGVISAKIGTHEPDEMVVKNVEQAAMEGGNSATIRSGNAKVDGFKQVGKHDNVLDIGNS